MKTVTPISLSLVVLMLAGLDPRAVQAQTEVTFFDGGYAEMCSAAAKSVGQPGAFQVTGSRLGVPPLDICNLAIKDNEIGPSIQAGNYNNRGVLYFAQGLLEEALKDFDEAIRLEEGLALAHVNRGYTLVALERWSDSIAAFDRGIALGVEDLDKAHFNRGISHEETGNTRQAYYDYKRASELNPEWEQPKAELARFTVTRK
jgi:tetratricopeptide (TPR) repeat protein